MNIAAPHVCSQTPKPRLNFICDNKSPGVSNLIDNFREITIGYIGNTIADK